MKILSIAKIIQEEECRGENVWQLLALFEIRPASYSQVLNDKK